MCSGNIDTGVWIISSGAGSFFVRDTVKYLCLAYYDPNATEALPKAELAAIVEQCPPHDEALKSTGRLILQGSLGGPAETRAVRPRRSRKERVTDGPFTESKEVVGGFFVIEATDMEDAVLVASLHPAGQIGAEVGWGIEIWPVHQLVQYETPSIPRKSGSSRRPRSKT